MVRLTRIMMAVPRLFAAGFMLSAVFANSMDRHVIQLAIDGGVDPATENYVARSLETAALSWS